MIPAILLAAAIAFGRLPLRPSIEREPDSTVADLARLLIVAVSGGMPLGSALERVAPMLSGPLGERVRDVLRRARRVGLTSALLAGDLGPLGAALARANSTGASVIRTLHAHLAAADARRVTDALERARTAPVKLMAPLVCLLLPGFVLLVVGPGLADQFMDLTFLAP